MSDVRALKKPEKRTVKRIRRKCIKPAHMKDIPTGEEKEKIVWIPELDDKGDPVTDKRTGQTMMVRTVEREPIVDREFQEAEFDDFEVLEDVYVVETIPLTKKQLKIMPRDQWPAPEIHEFKTQAAAKEFFAARQRQGFGDF